MPPTILRTWRRIKVRFTLPPSIATVWLPAIELLRHSTPQPRTTNAPACACHLPRAWAKSVGLAAVALHVPRDQRGSAEAGFLKQLQSSGRGHDLAQREPGVVGIDDRWGGWCRSRCIGCGRGCCGHENLLGWGTKQNGENKRACVDLRKQVPDRKRG